MMTMPSRVTRLLRMKGKRRVVAWKSMLVMLVIAISKYDGGMGMLHGHGNAKKA